MFVSFLNSLVGMFSLFFHFHHETLRLLFLLFCGCLFLKISLVLCIISHQKFCGVCVAAWILFQTILGNVLYLVNQKEFEG